MLVDQLAAGLDQLEHHTRCFCPGLLATLRRTPLCASDVPSPWSTVNTTRTLPACGGAKPQRQHENLKHFNGLNQELLDANLEASRFSGPCNLSLSS